MADIFISYSKTERQLTESLAKDLEAAGYTVWWDTNLITGDAYQKVIVEELRQSRASIVIWTPSSTQSEWVYSEATRANRDKKLIPVRVPEIDIYDIPPPFDVRQTELITNRRSIFAALKRIGVLPTPAAPSVSDVPSLSTQLEAPISTRGPIAPARQPDDEISQDSRERDSASLSAQLQPEASDLGAIKTRLLDMHWRRTKSLAISVLTFWVIVALLIHVPAASLNRYLIPIFNFPLGFYMAAQGSLILFVGLLYWFIKQQDHIDKDSILV